MQRPVSPTSPLPPLASALQRGWVSAAPLEGRTFSEESATSAGSKQSKLNPCIYGPQLGILFVLEMFWSVGLSDSAGPC